MSDTHRDRGLSVTVKYGKGYDETWTVFQGSAEEIREDIVSYFGLDRASVADLTLNELVINVTRLAHGIGIVASALGASVISEKESASSTPAQPTGEAAWAAAGEPAVNPLLAQIEAVTTVDALKLLWAENQGAFADADLMAAWKAKGKTLAAA